MSLLFAWMLEQRDRAINAPKVYPATIEPHCESTDAARHDGADSMLDFAIRERDKTLKEAE